MLNKGFLLKLKELRNKHHFSQELVAQKSFMSRRKYIDIENGKSNPSIEDLIQLSDIYGVDLTNLYTEYLKYTNFDIKSEFDEIEFKLSDMIYDDLKVNLLKIEYFIEANKFIKQYYYIIYGFYYSKSKEVNYEKALDYLLSGIKINHPDFKIDNYQNFNLNSLELRALVTIAGWIGYKGNLEKQFEII